MAKLNNKEFAARCGMEPKNLYSYITRGQIIVVDGFFDTEGTENRLFIEKQAAKRDILPVNSPATEEMPAKSRAKTSENTTLKGHDSEYKRKLLEQKEAEIERSRLQSEKLKMELAKMEGKVVPAAPMFTVIKSLSRHTMLAMKAAMEKILIDLAHKYDISAEDVAKTRGIITAAINAANESGVEMTVKNIDNIISEHSEQRGVGQRKIK